MLHMSAGETNPTSEKEDAELDPLFSLSDYSRYSVLASSGSEFFSCFPSAQLHSSKGCPCLGQSFAWHTPGLSDTPSHPPVQIWFFMREVEPALLHLRHATQTGCLLPPRLDVFAAALTFEHNDLLDFVDPFAVLEKVF